MVFDQEQLNMIPQSRTLPVVCITFSSVYLDTEIQHTYQEMNEMIRYIRNVEFHYIQPLV